MRNLEIERKMKNKQISVEALNHVASRFRILGEPMRLRILHQLMDGELNVTELVQRLGSTQANISRHLAILVREGIIYKRKEGVQIYCGIADETIFRLCDIVSSGLQKEFASRV